MWSGITQKTGFDPIWTFTVPSFDHLVGAAEQRGRDGDDEPFIPFDPHA
jgi:hypothetical protein